MPNRLAEQSSPYLLQHKDNPVDWYAWGPEALEKSKAEDKPIFLSIGYSACHWCHVMEHESFEDPHIAEALNAEFVCIKVDREERPDLDQVYMNAVQLLTGRGGWPMSVFLTPDLEPFFGGTYWPPTDKLGMPGFDRVIAAVSEIWKTRRGDAVEQAAELTRHLHSVGAAQVGDAPTLETLEAAATQLERTFDFAHGGFGNAPKFPHAIELRLLLRVWRRTGRANLLDMVRQTLDKMARGGIYDHLAGGFARYSVDAQWLVPHFEKMLYDNALLTGAYLDGYLATGESQFARVAAETLDYVLRYMTDPQGGFHSTEDADSEGEEGKFYLWTLDEVRSVLGPEAAERFCYAYDVTEEGNFERRNILNMPKTLAQDAALHGWDVGELEAELAESRKKLLDVRDARVRPGKDDKVLVSWNGLMIDSMARAGGVLDRPDFLAAACRAAKFIVTNLRKADGRLLHTWRQGIAALDAYLDDYACLASALVTLYEATFDESWIDLAVELCDGLLAHFADREGGGFYFTADDHEQLIARTRDLYDSSVPSGNSMAATALVRLGRLTGRDDYVQSAQRAMAAASGVARQAPAAAGQLLIAADMAIGPLHEIVVLGRKDEDLTAAVLSDLRRRYIPNRLLACRERAEYPDGSRYLDALFASKAAESASPTVYVCQNFTCQRPVSGRDAVLELWDELGTSRAP